jgi:hypothetical protein
MNKGMKAQYVDRRARASESRYTLINIQLRAWLRAFGQLQLPSRHLLTEGTVSLATIKH